MTFGRRTLGKRVGTSKNGDTRWSWKCECGNKGVANITNIKRATYCVKCPRPRTERKNPNTRAGEQIGKHLLIRLHTADTSRGNAKYVTRCLRCGEESVRALKSIKQSEFCMHCRNKREVLGQLMTPDEASELFGIKKTLIWSRMNRKGMTFEEAVLAPKQRQNHTAKIPEEKACHACKNILPLRAFHRDRSRKDGRQGTCKRCRNKHRPSQARD